LIGDVLESLVDADVEDKSGVMLGDVLESSVDVDFEDGF